MGVNQDNNTKVDILIRFFKNNKFTSVLIFVCLIIIGLRQVTESGDSILRTLGFAKKYNVDQATNRGKFSSSLLENAWNRMFWMRAYTERIRLNASKEELNNAYQKYIDASEKWSSNIMNYYLGLEEYYPNSEKRNILQDKIQPNFISVGKLISDLKYSLDTMPRERIINRIDSIQQQVNDINVDFYFLIDQKTIGN
jgi:hypothetical protein